MKKILIISASAGAGHTIAARAVEHSLYALKRDDFGVVHIDLLHFSTALYKMIYHDVYLYMAAKQPHLYGYVYEASDRIKRNKRPDFLWRWMDSLNSRKFINYMMEGEWSAVVSTHYLATQLVADLKRKRKLSAPLATITTDYGLHAYWFTQDCEHYVVADDAVRNHLAGIGILPDRIHAFGIPVMPVFAENKSRRALKNKLQLRPGIPTVLLLSGGFGVGPIEQSVRDLEKVKTSFQLIAVAGKNKKLYQLLREMARRTPFHLKAIGYTDQMDEYMKASDIAITKPGGLTTAEAMACGLPMIVINPIPGQEDMNSDMVLENGAGVKAMHPVDVAFKLQQVLSTPGRLAAMRAAAQALGKPGAAERT
ncbi:MAG: glycosyltransferase, partial [Candidatus Edwardsbacteria bacterium]|nr:glycosyltransferase [Candidatus Edwardsbacteria bacterium]